MWLRRATHFAAGAARRTPSGASLRIHPRNRVTSLRAVAPISSPTTPVFESQDGATLKSTWDHVPRVRKPKPSQKEEGEEPQDERHEEKGRDDDLAGKLRKKLMDDLERSQEGLRRDAKEFWERQARKGDDSGSGASDKDSDSTRSKSDDDKAGGGGRGGDGEGKGKSGGSRGSQNFGWGPAFGAGGGGSGGGKNANTSNMFGNPGDYLFLGILSWWLYNKTKQDSKEVDWPEFVSQYVAAGNVQKIRLSEGRATATIRDGSDVSFSIGSGEEFEYKLEQAQLQLGVDPTSMIPVVYDPPSGAVSPMLLFWGGLALLVGYRFISKRLQASASKGGDGLGKGLEDIFAVYNSKAKMIKKSENIGVKFADVAGLPEAKQEVMEFVDFLRSPKRYEKLGAKIPKGALLTGPPGTGKTMLAKAAAGEAAVPFIHTSGSEFLEVYVGVGPSRVRDMFKLARENSPCIVFIDEIDAIGRSRDRKGFGGGNDERENTLNQLLVEMDGVSGREGVVVMAATNRVDILDKALLRPGRFDRQVALGNPDIKSREEIFMVHLKPLQLEVSGADANEATVKTDIIVDDGSDTATAAVASGPISGAQAPSTIEEFASRLAQLTPGFSGADIANCCNEAALMAARADADKISWHHFDRALDRVIGGVEKKSAVLSAKEKRTVAFHEAGHATAGWFLEHADQVLKVNIVPRSTGSLGYAQLLPKDEYLKSIEQLRDTLCVSLGGRVAEELFFGRDVVTTGASDDLNKVTKLAYAMVNVYGMNDAVGPLSFPDQGDMALRPYGEKTSSLMDKEVRKIVADAHTRCLDLLKEKSDLVEALALRLLEKEAINDTDLVEVLGPRPFETVSEPAAEPTAES